MLVKIDNRKSIYLDVIPESIQIIHGSVGYSNRGFGHRSADGQFSAILANESSINAVKRLNKEDYTLNEETRRVSIRLVSGDKGWRSPSEVFFPSYENLQQEYIDFLYSIGADPSIEGDTITCYVWEKKLTIVVKDGFITINNSHTISLVEWYANIKY